MIVDDSEVLEATEGPITPLGSLDPRSSAIHPALSWELAKSHRDPSHIRHVGAPATLSFGLVILDPDPLTAHLGAEGAAAQRQAVQAETSLSARVHRLEVLLKALLQDSSEPLGPPAPPREEPPIVAAGRWIKDQGTTYKGQWVALRQSELIGVGPTLAALKEDLAQRGVAYDRLFVMQVP